MTTKIDFAKMGGLAPAIVQDDASNELLMLGFMNETAYQATLQTGYVTFFSRTRNELWMKGETSGNRLRVVVEGAGLVCHRGTPSCFTEEIALCAPVASAKEGVRP